MDTASFTSDVVLRRLQERTSPRPDVSAGSIHFPIRAGTLENPLTQKFSNLSYRPEIDGLRALAVLSVIGFHAFPAWCTGGFVGVDVFFVISGYLISQIIFASIEERSFSFPNFYARRVRRIFPALLLVLLASYVIGWFLLLPNEYKELGENIAGGASFISNFILWGESGYFDSNSDTKPLLHLWSLAIEEQFYILWPLLVVAAIKWRFNIIASIGFVAALSFTLDLSQYRVDSVGAFYSPATRYWELLAGAALAYAGLHREAISLAIGRWRASHWATTIPFAVGETGKAGVGAGIAATLGLALVVSGIFFFSASSLNPLWLASVTTVGTLLILASGRTAWLNRNLLSHPLLVSIGLISYPLYLWHWPTFTFLRILGAEPPPLGVLLAAILASFALAWLTYRFVERPIREDRWKSSSVPVLTTLMLAVGLLGYQCRSGDGLPYRPIAREFAIAQGLNWKIASDKSCSLQYKIAPCVKSGGPLRVMVMGDSHANHLFPGLTKSLGAGVIVPGSCYPALGVSLQYRRNEASSPCASMDLVSFDLKILSQNPTIDTVILSAFWRPVLEGKLIGDPSQRQFWGGYDLKSDIPGEDGLRNPEMIRNGLERTISSLLAAEKRVVFVRDTPSIDQSLEDFCLRRWEKPAGGSENCTIPRSDFVRDRVQEDALVGELAARFPSLIVFDPINLFCDKTLCYLTKDGSLLFRDQQHLSIKGSELLGGALANSLGLTADHS